MNKGMIIVSEYLIRDLEMSFAWHQENFLFHVLCLPHRCVDHHAWDTTLQAKISAFRNFGCRDQQEISFQEFENKILEPGLIDRIEVSHKSVAKIYVKDSPHPVYRDGNTDVDSETRPDVSRGNDCKYYFEIGSVWAQVNE